METKFFVHGMHCASCEILVEDKLSKVDGVHTVKANLKTSTVTVHANNEITADDLTKFVEDHGYKISTSQEVKTALDYKNLSIGFLIAGLIFGAFLLLQKLGIVNLLNPTEVTLPFVFLIGVVASLSTCMAVVGGLVLSISSSFAKERNYAPLAAFHLSRIIGFFVLGGLIGLLGSAFILNGAAYLALNTALFVVMVIMALNLLNVFNFTNKLQVKLPKFMGRQVLGLQNKQGFLPAALAGAATFVLPCGFTQSMQIYSLTTGNFLQGALTMFVFALGTFPVLSLISFASFKLKSPLFFTTAGFLILLFAVFNFVSGLRGFGLF